MNEGIPNYLRGAYKYCPDKIGIQSNLNQDFQD